MRANDDYRLLVSSDGEVLHVGVEGDIRAAAHGVHEVRLAAQKLGIAVRVDHRRPATELRSRRGS